MNIKRTLLAALALTLPLTGARATIFTTNATIAVGNTTYEGEAIVVSNCTLTVNGPHSFASLLLTSNAVVTHTTDPGGTNGYRLQLTLSGNCTIESGCRLDVAGRGYAGTNGPGSGLRNGNGEGTGAGHGGLGGTASGGGAGGKAYGDLLAPVTLGSGGGDAGGAGGGAVRLSVGGTLRVDGQMVADGAAPGSSDNGGGSGGSLWMTAAAIEGAGALSANGGTAGTGGGGAGGRIAVICGVNNFAGSRSASGGGGNEYGGAGTIYSKLDASPQGEVLVDNAGHKGQWTPLTTPVPFALTVANHGLVQALEPLTNGALTIRTNGLISGTNLQAGVSLTVLGDATLEPGGKIDLSGRGYAAFTGPGTGIRNGSGWGSGAGHGGVGGTPSGGGAGGGVYGSIFTPTTRGSGGGDNSGGAGGGALRLVVGGTLRVDGLVSVSGAAPSGSDDGGGAGGSLWAEVGTLDGTGAITAAGGGSTTGGGGAGGRIALYFASNLFTGDLTAAGAAGFQFGGPGTIYTKAAAATHGQVLLDNRGNRGLTRLNQTLWPTGEVFGLTLTRSAHLRPTGPLTFQSLVLTNGALISHDAATAGFHLATLGDATISADSAINVTALGYTAGLGPGAGIRTSIGYGTGAGHGGAGARAAGGGSGDGGGIYGSSNAPVTLGSGGGDSAGGAGGGAVRLTVGGTLRLDGLISANGTNSFPGDDGGGSGGSVWITADTLVGTGWLTANGGSAPNGGGGGGGGRIAISTFDSTGFDSGHITVLGGVIGGGAGTRFFGVPASRLDYELLGAELRLSWRTGLGANYQLQSATNLPAANWLNLGAAFPGTGGVLTTNIPIGSESAKFFRLQSSN